MSLPEIDELFHQRGGLRGLCGDNDMRVVVRRADAGDADASLALDVYCHRLRRYVGAFHAVLGRLDAITFTGGRSVAHWRPTFAVQRPSRTICCGW